MKLLVFEPMKSILLYLFFKGNPPLSPKINKELPVEAGSFLIEVFFPLLFSSRSENFLIARSFSLAIAELDNMVTVWLENSRVRRAYRFQK